MSKMKIWKNLVFVVVGTALLSLGDAEVQAAPDPNDTDLVYWIHGDAGVLDAGNVAASVGDIVETWEDQSLTGSDATRTFGDPRLVSRTFLNSNDYNGIRFESPQFDGFAHNAAEGDGYTLLINDPMELSELPDMAWSIFMVVRPDEFYADCATTQCHRGQWITCQGGTAGVSIRQSNTQNDKASIFVGGPGAGELRSDIKLIMGSPVLWVGTFNVYQPDPNDWEINLVVYDEFLGTLSDSTKVRGPWNPTNNPAHLGYTQLTSNSQYVVGEIYEIIIYDSNDAQLVDDTTTYLADKYGINTGAYIPTCAETAVYLPRDFDQDCYITLPDFAVFAADWMKCNDPQNPACL